MAVEIHPLFTIVGPNDTTRDYGDSINNFKSIVDSVNLALVDVSLASIGKTAFVVVNASMYWVAPNASIWSWPIKQVTAIGL